MHSQPTKPKIMDHHWMVVDNGQLCMGAYRPQQQRRPDGEGSKAPSHNHHHNIDGVTPQTPTTLPKDIGNPHHNRSTLIAGKTVASKDRTPDGRERQGGLGNTQVMRRKEQQGVPTERHLRQHRRQVKTQSPPAEHLSFIQSLGHRMKQRNHGSISKRAREGREARVRYDERDAKYPPSTPHITTSKKEDEITTAVTPIPNHIRELQYSSNDVARAGESKSPGRASTTGKGNGDRRQYAADIIRRNTKMEDETNAKMEVETSKVFRSILKA